MPLAHSMNAPVGIGFSGQILVELLRLVTGVTATGNEQVEIRLKDRKS